MKTLKTKDTNIFHYLFFVFSILIMALLLTHFDYIYGSVTDWQSQHFAFPEYFRMRFYETKSLFPDFDLNQGAGQNIYNFSYYGLYSPLMWISFLLPFVPMRIYISAISIISVIISVILIYRWLCSKYPVKTAFIAALLFEFASPLMFHTHRHIMFITYMPFLIAALWGAEKYLKDGRRTPLILSTFFVILSNYYFSVSCILVICIYGLLFYLKENKKSKLKDTVLVALRFAGNISVSVMMSAILWLPTLYVLTSGRETTKTAISLKDLFLPMFSGNTAIYGSYSLGLTALFVAAVAYGIVSKDVIIKILSIILACASSIGIIVFVLNGTMYLDGKVLIPFLPLAVYVEADFIEKLIRGTLEIRKAEIAIICSSVFAVITYRNGSSRFFLIDMIITFLIVEIMSRKKDLKIPVYAFAVIAAGVCLGIGSTDSLVTTQSAEAMDFDDGKYLIEQIGKEEESLYRTAIYANEITNINRIYDIDHLSTTLYSSVENSGYKDFFYNGIHNEMRYRNSATMNQSNNLLFNIFMGNKYAISKQSIGLGYDEIATRGGIGLYENKDAYPIGFLTDNIMNTEEFEKLSYPEDIEALMTSAVTDEMKSSGNFTSHIMPVDISQVYNFSDAIESEKTGENTYFIKIKGDGKPYESKGYANRETVSLKLNEPISNSVLLLRVKVGNTNYLRTNKSLFKVPNSGESSREDIIIDVNGVKNKLSNPNWKYYNGNEYFEYTISDNSPIEQIDISFYEGEYTVSDFEAYTLDYDVIKRNNDNIDEFIIDREKTNGDIVEGEINAEKEGMFILTFPYDKGFNIKVDGKETKYSKVNKSFIGFRLEEGKHNIEIEYKAPFKTAAMYISLIGFIILIGLLSSDRRQKKVYSQCQKCQ